MKIKAVIGAAYGDEGKGLMTDYFCAQIKADGRVPVVVRFNGGAQAGHTVVTPEGQRHVFHHFGSGTFVGASTYLTKDFIVNPITFDPELVELKKLGLNPVVIAHPDCRVTLPLDMILNQKIEESRLQHRGRHGSCGLGINETVERCENFESDTQQGFFNRKFTLNSLIWLLDTPENLELYLNDVCENWCIPRATKLIKNKELLEHTIGILRNPRYREEFILSAKAFASNVRVDRDFIHDLDAHTDLVFEGAQGLRLDQNAAGFPHLTRSNTGLQNVALTLSDISRRFSFEAVYATRAYTTRHGAGPMLYEKPMPDFVVDPTNVPNLFQGTLRYSPLNFDGVLLGLNGERQHQLNIFRNPYCNGFTSNIAVTCLDQVIQSESVEWIEEGYLKTLPGQNFVELMQHKAAYCSFGPTRSTVKYKAV